MKYNLSISSLIYYIFDQLMYNQYIYIVRICKQCYRILSNAYKYLFIKFYFVYNNI